MQVQQAQFRKPFKPVGFRPVYHLGFINHCPGCDQTQWHIGHSSAQCAFCGTAVPFSATHARAA